MRTTPACPGLPGFVLAALVRASVFRTSVFRTSVHAGLVLAAAAALAGCATAPVRPAYYIAAPPPGEHRCVEFREDMYGRRYCSKYYPS